MRDYFRRDARFQNKLGIYSSSSSCSVSISLGVIHTQSATPLPKLPLVSLAALVQSPPLDAPEQLFINLIALIPRERVVSFNASLHINPQEELFFTMPNIETLRLSDVRLSEGFLQPNPDGPHANTKLLPSLRSLCLDGVTYLNDEDWSLLVTYLTHQTSDYQAISLEVIGDFPYYCPEVVSRIEGLVKEFSRR